jgi:hypothetical protein
MVATKEATKQQKKKGNTNFIFLVDPLVLPDIGRSPFNKM